MSHQKRRRWAETLLAEVRGLRREVEKMRAEQDPAPRARGEWEAIFGAAFVHELYAAQPRGLDDDAVDRALEAAAAADWAAERRGTRP